MTDWLDLRWPPIENDLFRGQESLKWMWFHSQATANKVSVGDRVLLYETYSQPAGRRVIRWWNARKGSKAIVAWGVVTGSPECCEGDEVKGKVFNIRVPFQVKRSVPRWDAALGVRADRVRQITKQTSGRKIPLRCLLKLRPGEFEALRQELERRCAR